MLVLLPLPSQYNKANVAQMDEDSDSDSTFDDTEFVGLLAAICHGVVLVPC